MGCLGVHFALTDKDVAHLRSFEDEQERLSELRDVMEEEYLSDDEEHFAAESDKSWDAMHRALTDGKLKWDGGEYPLSLVVLGGERLYAGDDYLMSLKTPKEVKDIDAALGAITEEEFKRRYLAIDARDYGFPVSEEDFGYTRHWFQDVRAFYSRAANEGRYVLFTADQ